MLIFTIEKIPGRLPAAKTDEEGREVQSNDNEEITGSSTSVNIEIWSLW